MSYPGPPDHPGYQGPPGYPPPQPPFGYPPYPPPYPPPWGAPDPVQLARGDLETETRRARQAWYAVLVYAALAVATSVAGMVWEAHTHTRVREFRQAFGRSPDLAEYNRLAMTTRQQAVQVPLQLLQIPSIVLFLRWVHSAAMTGRRLGWPARHSPGKAVGSWFIPIGNLWLPFQGLRDALPPRDPRREAVGRWWAVQVARFVVGLLAVAVGAFELRSSGSAGALYALGVMNILLVAAWVVTFRPVLDSITTAHSDALGRIVSGAAPGA